MKRVRRRRSAVFDIVTTEHDSVTSALDELEQDFESTEDRVRSNLKAAQELCAAWRRGSGAPGSDEMVDKVRHWERCLRGELIGSADRWRVVDYATALAKTWRDLEANEALHRPLAGKRRSADALPVARKKSADRRRVITPEAYATASNRAKTRKDLARLLGCSLESVRKFERRQGKSQP